MDHAWVNVRIEMPLGQNTINPLVTCVSDTGKVIQIMRTFVVLAHSLIKICRCFVWMYDPPIHSQWMTQLPLTYQETHLIRHTVNGMWLPCFLSKCSTVTLELQLYCVTKKYPQLKYRLHSLLEMWIIFFYLLKRSWLGGEVEQRGDCSRKYYINLRFFFFISDMSFAKNWPKAFMEDVLRQWQSITC